MKLTPKEQRAAFERFMRKNNIDRTQWFLCWSVWKASVRANK